MQIEKITREVKKIVDENIALNLNIISAYSDGSFSREDMVPGSDVDIGLVVDGFEAGFKVFRKIIDNLLYEWAYIDKKHYIRPDDILKDAGFVHDIVNAKIWYDPDYFLKDLQSYLKARYTNPDFIKIRALNQLKFVEDDFLKFQHAIDDKNQENILRSIFTIVKHSFAIPTALLNRPVTNRRAYAYCKRDAEKLGFQEYPDLILKILGSSGFSEHDFQSLLDMAYHLFELCGLPEHEVELNKIHLFIKVDNPGGAVWSIFFWLIGSRNVLNAKGCKEIIRNIDNLLQPILNKLNLTRAEDIKSRIETIKEVIKIGKEMINKSYGV